RDVHLPHYDFHRLYKSRRAPGTRLALDPWAASDSTENMQTIDSIEDAIREFRRTLPTGCGTAKAIDQNEPWDRIAISALEDGHVVFANALTAFIESCLRGT